MPTGVKFEEKVNPEDLKNLPAIPEIPKEPCLYDEDPLGAYLWARDAWWRERETAKDIAALIGIPLHRVRLWIHGGGPEEGWKKSKSRAIQKLFSRFQQDEREKIENLLIKMLNILGASIEVLLDENVKLSVSEFNSMANAFEKLFKMRQLILGQATEIFGVGENKDVTWDNVVRKIREVDILDYEKVADIAESKKPVD